MSFGSPSRSPLAAVLVLSGAFLALRAAGGCPTSVSSDAGPLSTDGGSASTDDAGPGPSDAGTGDHDAGAPSADAGVDDCGDGDPLTFAHWAGFCDDRADDNCTVDHPEDPCPFQVSVHHACNTGDELCPATQPSAGPPRFDCTGSPGRGILAYASLEAPTAQVASLCVFVYEGGTVPGEHYVAVSYEGGEEPAGPDALCTADFLYRHHLFLSNLDDGACPPVTVPFPSSADDFVISNACRKAIRPLELDDPQFDPDIQFFATTEAEARAKLAILESVEVGCLRAADSDGFEVRPWVSQLVLPLTIVPPAGD